MRYRPEPFCGWWMHNGMLQLDGVKMSKSLGNLVLARNLMKEFEPDHLRLYLLSNHLRTNVDYHEGDLPALRPSYERLKAVASQSTSIEPDAAVLAAAYERLDDDFDVPGCLKVLDDAAAASLANFAGGEAAAAAVRTVLASLGFAFAGARGPENGDLNP